MLHCLHTSSSYTTLYATLHTDKHCRHTSLCFTTLNTLKYIASTHLCANLITPSLLNYALIVLHLYYASSHITPSILLVWMHVIHYSAICSSNVLWWSNVGDTGVCAPVQAVLNTHLFTLHIAKKHLPHIHHVAVYNICHLSGSINWPFKEPYSPRLIFDCYMFLHLAGEADAMCQILPLYCKNCLSCSRPVEKLCWTLLEIHFARPLFALWWSGGFDIRAVSQREEELGGGWCHPKWHGVQFHKKYAHSASHTAQSCKMVNWFQMRTIFILVCIAHIIAAPGRPMYSLYVDKCESKITVKALGEN